MSDLKLFCQPKLKTIKQFADFYNIRVVKEKKKDNDYTYTDFFEYNRETIFEQLDVKRRIDLAKSKQKKVEDLDSSDIDIETELPYPGYLFIDEKNVNCASLAVKHTNFQIQSADSISFEDEIIRNIVDTSYSTFRKGVARNNVGCRVIGFFKSMYYADKSGNDKIDNIYDSSQNFIDLSKFVVNINTNVSQSGGNFTLTFPHLPVYSDSLSNDMIVRIVGNKDINSGDYINKNQMGDFYPGGGNEISVKSSIDTFNYLEWLIQPNDLLFISFDDIEDLVDDKISGHNFDMIGLVDNVSISRNASGNVNVDVSGRDLMKLLTDDSSIYFPEGVSSGRKSIFDNTETTIQGGDLDSVSRYKSEELQDGTPRQLTGLLNIFASEPNDFTIDFVLKTIISHLANMQIVPDDLFSSWGDKRTRFSSLKPKK
jgi:hypothetical protein